MKSSSWVATVVVAVAGVAFACSSAPSHPPLQTTGGTNPGPSPGGGSGRADGGTDGGVPYQDAGPGPSTDGAVEGGVCTGGNCSGCCDAINNCQTGTFNAACGVLGVSCVTCTAGTTCSGGFCQ